MRLWETPTRYRESLRALPRAITRSTASAGTVTFLMVLMGPAVLIFQASAEAGLTAAETGSWYFAVFAGAGLMELILALGYRQPVAAGVALPAVAVLVQVLPGFTLAEAAGAYLAYGGLILLLGFSGGFGRAMELIPRGVILGMLAGLMLRFGTGIFRELVAEPALVTPIVLAWLVAVRWLQRWVPPLAAALAVGIAASLWLHPPAGGGVSVVVGLPVPVVPVFSVQALLSIGLPLLLLVLSAQNVSGIGVLWAYRYRPPANSITLATGLFTMGTALFGGHGVALGSPRSGICADPASHPDRELRFGAVVVDAALLLLSAAFAPTLVRMLDLLPLGMIRTLAGLAMFPVVQQSFVGAFTEGEGRMGALFALLIAAADRSWLGISAVFWSLLLGTLVSRLAEARARPAHEAE